MSPTPYAADLVVPIAWGVVGLLLAALAYALLRGRRAATAATGTAADNAPDAASPILAPTARTTGIPDPTTTASSPDETATPTTAPATAAMTAAAPAAWDQGQPAPDPAPEPAATDPAPDVREMRVLRRQVDVLTRTLAEWEQVRGAEQPAPDAAAAPPLPPAPPAAAPAPAPGPVPRPSLPGAAYLDLSRRLAERGDLEGAVLAQWACDLEVLRGPLAGHEGDLATAVAAVTGQDPVAVLRGCREAALALVAVAGPVRTLLAPLDHLLEAAVAQPTDQQPGRTPSAGFPAELVDLAPEADRPALSALVAGRQGRS